MAISAKDVKALRDRTGVGMMDAKRALQEVNGDMEKAIDYLREAGLASAAKKAGRIAAEGLATVALNDNKAVIVEINSETDFVAKNEKFQTMLKKVANALLETEPSSLEAAQTEAIVDGDPLENYVASQIAVIGEKLNVRRFEIFHKEENDFFGSYLHLGGKIGVLVHIEGGDQALAQNIAMHIGGIHPQYISQDDVDQSVVEHEREVLREQALNEGKPEKIVDKMVEGRLRKFFEDICLVDQAYLIDSDKTVGQVLKEAGAKVVSFARYEVGEGLEKRQDDFAAEVQKEMSK